MSDIKKRSSDKKATVKKAVKNRSAKKEKEFIYTLDARPDTVDFRDLMYLPTLKEVPKVIKLNDFKKKHKEIKILNQGKEGSCTGFALANVANFLLNTRSDSPDNVTVSPFMLYEFAKRYDEWPGEEYSGSSIRGAIKAWHKHGVCSEETWNETRKDRSDKSKFELFIKDSQSRPLGAYFRVNHKDLVAIHNAMAEVGILYASANVHENWKRPVKVKSNDQKKEYEHIIEFDADNYHILGGHAFAIVAYDRYGFWIQNSWGESWGDNGFAKISYDDWLLNGTDVWVVRLGVPVNILTGNAKSSAFSISGHAGSESTFYQFRPHIISIGNNGKLKESGTYGNNDNELVKIIESMDVVIKEFEKKNDKPWKKRKIILYAHGGLVPEESVLQRLSDYRETMLNNQVYPIFFMWHSDFWSSVKNILADSLNKRKTEDFLGGIKDFMLDRMDDFLEYISRTPGKILWDEMKENAAGAAGNKDGGARKFLKLLSDKIGNDDRYEIHLIGHSAGSIFLAPVIELLTSKNPEGLGRTINTCTLWAPACTVDVFLKSYKPSIENGTIKEFNLYTLSDNAEQEDNCGSIYNKSLLYLVSNSFEKVPKIPVTLPYGTPIFGMQKFIDPSYWNDEEKLKINNSTMRSNFETNKQNAEEIKSLFSRYKIEWIRSPDDSQKSNSQTHGGFDDDKRCVESTFAAIIRSDSKLIKKGDDLIPVNLKHSSVYNKERIHKLAGKMRSNL